MGMQETTSIAVCAVGSADLESLATAVREVGAWSIVPIQWPNAPALVAARSLARALVLHSGIDGANAPCDPLIALLADRPDATPLIVVGSDPTAAAAPDVWLPTMPPSSMLGAVISHLINSRPEPPAIAAAPAWR